MKGISPLIAVVLIIAFVVAMGGIVNVWLTGLSTDQTGVITQDSDTFVNCASNTIQVTEARYDETGLPSIVNVTVSTGGSVAMKNLTISVAGGGSTTSSQVFFNGSTDSMLAGSVFATSIDTTGGALLPPETVLVSALCDDRAITGVCRSGQSCMVSV